MNKRFAALLSAVVVVALLSGGSARAADSIDALKASDAELTKALSDLDGEVKHQQAEVDAAAQSVSAADQAVIASESAVSQTQAQIDVLRSAAAQRAVEEYMKPMDNGLAQVLSSDGFIDAGRRTALLEEVNNRGRDAIEELSAARTQLVTERTTALAARAVADQRRSTAQQKLDQLTQARAEKLKLDQDLQNRIETANAEDDASASASFGGSSASRANRGGAALSDDSRISAAGMLWPITGPIRSPFGARWGKMHTGIDIGAAEGDAIRAAKAGTVIQAGYDGSGYGNLVKIDHGGGVQTWYAHQSRIVIANGATVSAGELIGYVGHTGHVVPASAAGAHLHFEVRIGGTPRNPQQYLP